MTARFREQEGFILAYSLNLAFIISPLGRASCQSLPQMSHDVAPRIPLDPITHEQDVYQHGLQHELPPFTFDSTKWEELAMACMSAESTGMSMARLEQA